MVGESLLNYHLLNVNHYRQRCHEHAARHTHFTERFKAPLFYSREVVRPGGIRTPGLLVRSRGPEITRICRNRENATKIKKLLQAGTNHLPFPLHFFFPILRRFSEICMTLL